MILKVEKENYCIIGEKPAYNDIASKGLIRARARAPRLVDENK